MDDNQLSPEDLPPSLLAISQLDLRDLQDDDTTLHATRALLRDASPRREAIISEAEHHLEDVEQLSNQLSRIELLKNDVGELQSEEMNTKHEWEETEESMTSKLEPFSIEGIFKRISDQVDKLSVYTKSLEDQILSSYKENPEETILLTRRYDEAFRNLKLLENTKSSLEIQVNRN